VFEPLKPLITRPPRHFGDNAPISEALIDIRASADSVPLDALRSFNKGLEHSYPKVRLQQEWAGQIRLGAEANASMVTSKHGVRGYLFLSEDEKQIVQARRDGFTFSRLWPYDSFDALRDEAKRLWLRYVEVASPKKVTRLAVRYVNKIGFEEEPLVLSEWFHLHPVAPPPLGAPMSDYLVRLVLPHPKEPRYVAIVTQGTSPPHRQEHKNAVVLDIDVWTNANFEPDDKAVWNVIGDLRTYKNDLFFASITKRTEEWLDGGTAGPG
jgi:uncharacterized protein (TIGR04255 family)